MWDFVYSTTRVLFSRDSVSAVAKLITKLFHITNITHLGKVCDSLRNSWNQISGKSTLVTNTLKMMNVTTLFFQSFFFHTRRDLFSSILVFSYLRDLEKSTRHILCLIKFQASTPVSRHKSNKKEGKTKLTTEKNLNYVLNFHPPSTPFLLKCLRKKRPEFLSYIMQITTFDYNRISRSNPIILNQNWLIYVAIWILSYNWSFIKYVDMAWGGLPKVNISWYALFSKMVYKQRGGG